jgi:hypothetical protein
MARIAFFSEKLPPSEDPIAGFAFELMKSLADQEHDVRVFSTYKVHEAPEQHARIQVLRPFRRWSWFEVPRLLPLLIEFQPEILHFIQPHEEALRGFTNAMSALPGFAPLIGRPKIVTSFYDLKDESFASQKFLLMASDAVIASNPSQAALLNSWLSLLGRKLKVAIATLPHATGVKRSSADDEFSLRESASEVFFHKNQRVIFIPGDIIEHRDRTLLFAILARILEKAQDTAVLFGGSWNDIGQRERKDLMSEFSDRDLGGRVLVTGPLSIGQEKECLQKAHLVLVASLPTEGLRVARLLREATAVSAVLVIHETQVRLDTLPWCNHETSLIVKGTPSSWEPVLTEALTSNLLIENIRQSLPEFLRHETIDHPGNHVSRIYAQLLAP